MRYIHNVLFNFDLKEMNPEILVPLVEKFHSIQGIQQVYFGKNSTPETDKMAGFNYGLTIFFDSYEKLEAYATHPHHESFKNAIHNYTMDVVVMDFPVI